MTALTYKMGSMRIRMARVRRLRWMRLRRRRRRRGRRKSYNRGRRMRIYNRVGGHKDQFGMGFVNHNLP